MSCSRAHQPCCQHPRKKSAKQQGQNTKSSDSSPDFLKQVLSPPSPRPEDGFCDSGKPHKWQLSTSQEKFERDTRPIGGGLRDSAEPSLVYCLGGNTSSPAGQLGISFLNHPSSHAQAVILQMSHPMNPAFPRQTHGLICPSYPSPSCNIQNPG